MNTPAALRPFLTRLERSAPLSERDRSAILALPFTPKAVAAENVLALDDGNAGRCFVVLSGLVGRAKMLPNGARQIISLHIPGDGIDLQRSLTPKIDHSVLTLTRAQVAVVPASGVDELVASHAGAGRAIWREILRDAAIQREWTLNVGRRNARTRLAHLLSEIGWRMRSAGLAPHEHFDVNLTQVQLADLTGLTPVHINRTLQGLRADRLLDKRKRPLRVIDSARLEAAGGFNASYLDAEA